jgi:predicted nucleic acid-binding protein
VKRTYTLIVTDTSPLITLALAGELDLLLRLGTPVSIPDAVFNEATRVRTAGGASAIVEWVNAHLHQVHIAPTEVGIDQQRRLEEGLTDR